MKRVVVNVYIFAYNDLDHISPVISSLLEDPALSLRMYLPINMCHLCEDYRIRWFAGFENFSVEKVGKFAFLRNYIVSNRLSRNFIRNVVGLYSFKALFKAFQNNRLNSVSLVLYGWTDAGVLDLYEAAYILGIPSICLPHGLSAFKNFDASDTIKRIYEKTGRLPDFSDRNIFDLYVVQTLRHQKWAVSLKQDPEKVISLGSARFDPFWVYRNLELHDHLNEGEISSYRDGLSAVFFLPHWDYGVDRDLTLAALEMLVSTTIFQKVTVRVHTREGAGTLPQSTRKSLSEFAGVKIDEAGQLCALVRDHDVSIFVTGSVGYEAVVQRKAVIKLAFATENVEVYEDFPSLVYSAESQEDLYKAITEFETLIDCESYESERSEFISREIFGGRDCGVCVANLYSEAIAAVICGDDVYGSR